MSRVEGNTPAPAGKRAKTGGRAAGTPNKATKEFRETIAKVLDANASNVGKWLRIVAEGKPEDKCKGTPLLKPAILPRRWPCWPSSLRAAGQLR